jgi:hypothetical protein
VGAQLALHASDPGYLRLIHRRNGAGEGVQRQAGLVRQGTPPMAAYVVLRDRNQRTSGRSIGSRPRYDVSMIHPSNPRRAEQPCCDPLRRKQIDQATDSALDWSCAGEQLHGADEMWMLAAVVLSSRCLLILLLELRKLLEHTNEVLRGITARC